MSKNIRRKTFLETVDDFIDKKGKHMYFKNSKIKENTWKKMRGEKLKNSKARDYDLLIQEITPKNIRDSLIEILKAESNKDTLYKMCREYIKFINSNLDQYGIEEVEDLPVLYSDLERKIDLCKRMHAKYNKDKNSYELKVEKLEDEYLIDKRNLDGDLSDIQNGRFSFMGQKVQINFDRYNGQLTMESTAHPLFLVENLTQVIVMLNGLYSQSENIIYKEYAEETAINIWMQLSDYAKEKILNGNNEKLQINTEWYKVISEKASNRKKNILEFKKYNTCFKTEDEVSRNKCIKFFKNQDICNIRYIDEKCVEQELNDVNIVDLQGNKITFINKNRKNVFEIYIDDINLIEPVKK